MFEPLVRIASVNEHEAVEQFYRSEEGGSRSVDPADVILVAESDGHVVGAVRLCSEYDCLVLRGMRVRADLQRRGVGTRLLALAVELIGDRPCHCIPLAHLAEFYGRAGFALLPDHEVPPFLRERADRYRRMGDAITPMQRRTDTV